MASKILFKIPKVIKKPTYVISVLTNKFNYKYAVFPAMLTFYFKGILCLLRNVTKSNSGTNTLLAGFVAGFVSLF